MPSLLNKVVVHYLDGRTVKGVDQNFYPNRESFHVAPASKGAAVTVNCRELKAIFFVHDYDGNGKRQDLRGFLGGPDETRHGVAMHGPPREGAEDEHIECALQQVESRISHAQIIASTLD